MYNKIFDYSLELINKLFNVNKEVFLNKKTTHEITDLKKIVVLKFYDIKRSDDKILSFLQCKFDCYHSNIIYWRDKAKELCSVDIEFKKKYELFSNELNEFINRNKLLK